MSRRRKWLAGLALLAAGCVTAGRVAPMPGEISSDPAEVESLARGRAAWTRECAACHRLYWPGEYAPAEWARIAPVMGERAGLSDDLIRDLTGYLVRGSRAVSETGTGASGNPSR